jgi:hypothetical protein
MKTLLVHVLALGIFCVLQALMILVVGLLCRLWVAIGLRSWVFPTFLIGVPVAFLLGVRLTIQIIRRLM